MTNKFTPHFLPEGGSYVKQIATMEKPDYFKIAKGKTGSDAKLCFDNYQSIYDSHLRSLLQYPMPSMSEEFGKREVVVLGEDFDINPCCVGFCDGNCEVMGATAVAIPLPAAINEQIDWFNKTIKSYSEDYPKQEKGERVIGTLSTLPAPAVEDSVNRPKLTDYLSVEKFDLKDVVTIYESQPELFNYAKALDLYIDHLASTTPQENKGEQEDYPTYEQAGGDKKWDDMSELEQAYYTMRKLYNAIAVYKNTVQRLRAASKGVDEV